MPSSDHSGSAVEVCEATVVVPTQRLKHRTAAATTAPPPHPGAVTKEQQDSSVRSFEDQNDALRCAPLQRVAKSVRRGTPLPCAPSSMQSEPANAGGKPLSFTLENYVVSNVPIMVLVLRRGAKQSELCSLLLLLAHLIQKRWGQQRRAGLSGKKSEFQGHKILEGARGRW